MRKLTFIILGVVILFGVGAIVLVRHMSRAYGPGYTPERDLDKLVTIADSSRQFREALERFKSDQGHYPATVTNLVPSYLQPTNAPERSNPEDWTGWEYSPNPSNGYELFYQIDWDSGLSFEHSANGSNQWSWTTSDRVVNLTQKIEQK